MYVCEPDHYLQLVLRSRKRVSIHYSRIRLHGVVPSWARELYPFFFTSQPRCAHIVHEFFRDSVVTLSFVVFVWFTLVKALCMMLLFSKLFTIGIIPLGYLEMDLILMYHFCYLCSISFGNLCRVRLRCYLCDIHSHYLLVHMLHMKC
jgi:hypothetical protein